MLEPLAADYIPNLEKTARLLAEAMKWGKLLISRRYKCKILSVYYGNTPALHNVNLTVDHGEYLGIIGPNGGGKTTLIRVILGLLRPRRAVCWCTESPPATQTLKSDMYHRLRRWTQTFPDKLRLRPF